MKLCRLIAWTAVAWNAVVWASPVAARAEIIQTNAASPAETGFLTSTSDLVHAGGRSLLSTTHAGYAPFTYGGTVGGTTVAANLNDGLAGLPFDRSGYRALNTVAYDSDGRWTTTYRLDTTTNTRGYDVTTIRTLSGWSSSRRNQRFELLFSTIDAPDTFTSRGNYSFTPGGSGAARITLTDAGGAIARNVSAVRFSVDPAGGVQTVFREFDVFGGPTAGGPPRPFQRVAPNDPRIGYSDYARLSLDATEARFDRVIADAYGGLQNANPAARVRFRTDASTITASFTTGSLGVTQGTGVILVDGTRAGTFDARTVNATVEIDVPFAGGGYRDVELLMPFSQDLRFNGLLVDGEAGFQVPAARPDVRYVAYGDSITQGLWASDSFRNYPSLIGNHKGWEVVNMGFGWRGMKDSGAGVVDGSAVASLNADVISVMTGYNDASARFPAANYRASMEAFVARVREDAPTVPIYLISPLYSANAANQSFLLQYRDAISDLVGSSSDPHLHWIDGLLLGIDATNVASLTSDGIHPNDAGFELVASHLTALMTGPAPRLGSLALGSSGINASAGEVAIPLQVVPEPAAMGLVAAAAVVLGSRAARRRRRAASSQGSFPGVP